MKRLLLITALLLTLGSTELHAQGVYITDLPETINFAGEEVPIEFPYVREAIEREMLTTMCMHTSTMLTFRRMTRFFPMIEKILKENGIPDDFKYLAMAESGLNVEAMSPAKASGLWQFMTSAAKTYKLETGDNVDMRYNVEMAARAACRYFKHAYSIYGNWSLVAASYNVGIAGVTRRKDIQGVTTYWDLFLPEETMRYLPRIVAFKIVAANPSKYGFNLKESDYLQPFENYIEVKINDLDIKWSDFAKKYNTDYRQLRTLNPWIRSYSYHNKTRKTYTVKVPNEKFKKMGY